MSAVLHGDDRFSVHAACTEEDTEKFFPAAGTPLSYEVQAKEVCARCPVLSECLDYAMQGPRLSGVWGGTTERERRQMRLQPLEVGLPVGTHLSPAKG